MVPGVPGVAGAAARTAGVAGRGSVMIRLLCLVARPARETPQRNRPQPATVETAVQVRGLSPLLPVMMMMLPDTSDYLGCYKRYGGASRALKFFSGTLTPCLCVAYCASLNYSLAGASSGYITCHSVIAGGDCVGIIGIIVTVGLCQEISTRRLTVTSPVMETRT